MSAEEIVTLTKQPPRLSKAGQADEPAITPEMIRAGWLTLCRFGGADFYDEGEEIAESVFRAMLQAQEPRKCA